MSHPIYPYSEGDRLQDRNTYMYSEYHGQRFLTVWGELRAAVLRELPSPAAPATAPGSAPAGEGYATDQLLAHLLAMPAEDEDRRRLAERLLQRFEVSKRLYRRYDGQFKAQRDSGYDELALYLQFATLCASYVDGANPMPFLNALLKVTDSLIALRSRLDGEQGAWLAWLITRERDWVERIAAHVQPVAAEAQP